MDRIGINAVGKIGTDRTGRRFLGIGGTHEFAVVRDRVFTFQHLYHHRTRGHECHQVCEERPLAVNSIETLCLFAAEMGHPGRHDLEAGAFKPGINFTNDVGAQLSVSMDYVSPKLIRTGCFMSNSKIQGACADIMKAALISIHKRLPAGAAIRATCHDEVLITARPEDAESVLRICTSEMEEAAIPMVGHCVRFTAEGGILQSWGDK